MTVFGWVLAATPVICFLYAYLGYPAILWVASRLSRPRPRPDPPDEWPLITIVLPVYNEERVLARTIESLLALDYPADRRFVLVVSDASTDGTDQIARSYADRGVKLLRLPERSGKTGAENAAGAAIVGDIVVNTDATIRILPEAIKPLVAAFADPTVGVASGRDISVGAIEVAATAGESGYVGYEMWVRALETRCGGVVGASGCFYAIRRQLHDNLFPTALSRDFASALIAIQHRFRAVSVDDALSLVPRAGSLEIEYRRKTRTMARGLETLWYMRSLMNPLQHGRYAWMLVSHKLVRWLVFLLAPLWPLGLILAASGSSLARGLLLLTALGLLAGVLGWKGPRRLRELRLLRTLAFATASFSAGLVAWFKALRGELNPIWEPTRRPDVAPGA